jgi:hypothetical protein
MFYLGLRLSSPTQNELVAGRVGEILSLPTYRFHLGGLDGAVA